MHGSATLFGTQVAAGVGCSGYAFDFTYVMLKLIDLITAVRVRARPRRGLDAAMHGESAYVLGCNPETERNPLNGLRPA